MNPYGGYTTGSGYIAPQWQQQPQQQYQQPQQTAAPQQAAAPAPYSYGDLSGVQITEGGDHDLTTALHQKKTQLENWVTHMAHQGYDVVHPRTDNDLKHHKLFRELVGEMDYLKNQLVQGRENQKLRNAQIASGRIQPGAPGVDNSQPMGQSQFEQGFAQVRAEDNPYVVGHNQLLGKPATTQAELQVHNQSYANAVHAIQEQARLSPQGQSQAYATQMINALRQPAKGIERDNVTQEQTHWGSAEHMPSARGAGAAMQTLIGADNLRAVAEQDPSNSENWDVQAINGNTYYVNPYGSGERYGDSKDIIRGVGRDAAGKFVWVVQAPDHEQTVHGRKEVLPGAIRTESMPYTAQGLDVNNAALKAMSAAQQKLHIMHHTDIGDVMYHPQTNQNLLTSPIPANIPSVQPFNLFGRTLNQGQPFPATNAQQPLPQNGTRSNQRNPL